MGKKKRKPRPRPPGRPTAEKASAGVAVKPKKPSAPPPVPPDVYPPLRKTLAKSFAAATSPVILLAPFLLLGLFWVALRALGLEVFPNSPNSLVMGLSLPPFASLFDFGTAASLFIPGTTFFLFLFGLTIVRAVFLSLLSGMIDEHLEYGSVSILGVMRGLGAFWGMLLFCYLQSGLALMATQILPQMLGAQMGQTLSQVAPIAGLFFLGFMPGAAVRLRAPAPEVFLRSMKGARLPSWSRHLVLVVLYYFCTLLFQLLNPLGGLITANPTVLDWAWAMLATFVSMVFLAAFIERWKAASPYIPRQMRSRPVPKRR